VRGAYACHRAEVRRRSRCSRRAMGLPGPFSRIGRFQRRRYVRGRRALRRRQGAVDHERRAIHPAPRAAVFGDVDVRRNIMSRLEPDPSATQPSSRR
jgi:hypothetical protein